jgi:hypothetical protein
MDSSTKSPPDEVVALTDPKVTDISNNTESGVSPDEQAEQQFQKLISDIQERAPCFRDNETKELLKYLEPLGLSQEQMSQIAHHAFLHLGNKKVQWVIDLVDLLKVNFYFDPWRIYQKQNLLTLGIFDIQK